MLESILKRRNKMERVLLTGATGFIGKELAAKLAEKNLEVHSLELHSLERYVLAVEVCGLEAGRI